MAFTRDPNAITVSPIVEPLSDVVPDDGLVTLQQVMAITQLKKSSIYREISVGHFPAPIKVFGSNRWLRLEIVEYLMRRIVERNERYAKKNTASL
jgi:predicted DNA-binding transcriptional regulator AlpA